MQGDLDMYIFGAHGIDWVFAGALAVTVCIVWWVCWPRASRDSRMYRPGGSW